MKTLIVGNPQLIEMLEEFKDKQEKAILKYIGIRKKIQKLLLKETVDLQQQLQVSEYIFRLSLKLEEIEHQLRVNEVISYNERLYRWTTKELRETFLQ